MMSTYDWWVAKLREIRHLKPPEPPMRVRLHEAGHAVAGYRFGYVQQGIMLREDDTLYENGSALQGGGIAIRS